MPLFETIPVDEAQLRRVVADHWALELGACLKVSQNHTFAATRRDDGGARKFAVRATPDPDGLRQGSVEVELALLDYLHAHGLPVCASVPTLSNPARTYIRTNDRILVAVFEWAKGEPVVLAEWRWLTERPRVAALGRWFARLHSLTMGFAAERPEFASRARPWTELHDGILADAPVDERDAAAAADPSRFGIIHGDVNVSNYYHLEAAASPHMFDWDQVQRAWFLYDLSAPIWTVITVQRGGNPVDGTPVPPTDVEAWTDWLVEGYEAGRADDAGGGPRPAAVDRGALRRMVDLRRTLYKRFCRRAIDELPEDAPMAQFCRFMNSWLDKEPECPVV